VRALAVGGLVIVCGCSGTGQKPAPPTPQKTYAKASRTSGPPSSPATSTFRPARPVIPNQQLARCSDSLVSAMTIDDMVGQLLFVGVSAADPREGFSTVQRHHLGGVFLRGRSSLTPGQLKERLEVLQSAAAAKHVLRLHVAVDQEGGKVRNLQGQGFTQLPPATEQATWDDKRLGLSTAEMASEPFRVTTCGVA
jgi:beta-N-acetylhexosaminidase